MAINIKPSFNATDIAAILAKKKQKFLDAILSGLSFVGESFVANARNTNTYKDHTGNLRSSIGYVVYFNGEQVQHNFEGKSGEGAATGAELANSIAADHPKGFVLVCVAGMEYALYVEAKGFDVITNSSIKALDDTKQMVARLQQKLRA